MSSSSSTVGDEKAQVSSIPRWRLIFDDSAVTQDVIDHPYPGSGTTDDPYIISWIPNDPRDPMAFSNASKWGILFLISLTTLAVALASSAYTGALVEIITDFQISEEIFTLGISLFVIGFALGPVIWSPLSEHFGRRPVHIISAMALTVFCAGAAGAQNIQTLLILRFFAGSLGSAPMAVPGGVIADIFPAIYRGLAGGIWAIAPFLGPSIGPLVGGFLGQSAGWRWVQGLLAVFSGVVWLAVIFLLPETYPPLLMRKRAAKLEKITGKVYRSSLETEQTSLPVHKTLIVALSRPWVMLFTEPIVLLLSLYMAIVYGILYLFFAAFPIVFQKHRGWSEGETGLAFLGITVGIFFSVVSAAFFFSLYVKKAIKAAPSLLPPEARLPDSFLGAIMLPVGLFWFAWTNSPSVHWMAPVAAGIPFGYGMVSVFIPLFNYLIDGYTIYAASVLAANSILRSIFGAVFPLFTTYMFDDLGLHWAASIPAFLALACVPLPFFFYVFGARIRAKCHFSAESTAFVQKIMAARAAAAAESKD
ncbi:MFS general substrate transporter [Penicillium capsulatum]|uniref:MFS general substrate transporter n=1 Tax=Penicillium capsulatum TaxID=69766 RepID=A0A9W9LEW1_9EURO|nr:MFS general substrate transporter [Penicillium capsulatum]